MKTIKINKPLTLHRSTAELSLNRALQFLRTVGTDPAIYGSMQQTGFGVADVKQGWTLVLKACSAPGAATQFTPQAGPVAEATQKIEAWQSTMFLRAHAALRRLHPKQDAFVFENITPGSGAVGVVAVSMFLERLDALDGSPDRKATRKVDHAAMSTLERRGVTKAERKQAKELVHLVETTPAPEMIETAPPTDERMAALTELYGWVQDWSDCARSVIARRDQLLRLGIGKRRPRALNVPVVVTPPPTIVAPSPAAPQLAAHVNGQPNGAIVLAANAHA
jgi:hypothetical protein